MARYYFETDDDDFHYRDKEGVELSSPNDARLAALSALPDMVRDKVPGRDRRTFRSTVVDAQGAVVFEGTLTLSGIWRPSQKNG